MAESSYRFNTKSLCDLFNIDGATILEETYECDPSSYSGNGNPFYGLNHTEETKKIISDKVKKKLEDEEFKRSRINYGEKNGMYGSERYGELNPMWKKKHSKDSIEKMKGPRGYCEKSSKSGKLVSPDGIIYEFKGISKFCKEHNLNQSKISNVLSGKTNHHKGWKNAS
jgi:hypothetical protein